MISCANTVIVTPDKEPKTVLEVFLHQAKGNTTQWVLLCNPVLKPGAPALAALRMFGCLEHIVTQPMHERTLEKAQEKFCNCLRMHKFVLNPC